MHLKCEGIKEFTHELFRLCADMLNQKQSPIQDKELQEYLETKELDLTATTNGEEAYKDADFVIVSTPTNYDPKKNFFDTSFMPRQ